MWIGIDIGTSGVKTVLMDRDQTITATAHAALDVQRPYPGWSEQNPEDWWNAVLQTLDDLANDRPQDMAAVRGIGLSGQMHGATLLDKSDQVLRPCILWNDTRSHAQCEVLEKRAPFRGIGGNIVMPGFTAPKLEWVRENEPDLFEAVAKVLLPKDYIRLQLTGEYISDMSDSAGTLWLDVGGRDWSASLLSATGLDSAAVPQLVEGSEPGGKLRKPLCERWGMTGTPVVAGGAGDNAASACGVGAVVPGTGFLSLGTSGVLFLSQSSYTPNTSEAVHSFCHAVPDTWHQMGVMLAAGDSVNWLARLLNMKSSVMVDQIQSQLPHAGTEAPIFHPYLSGERTPHNLAHAAGGFSGLSMSHEREDLARAVLEGVAFGMADCAKALGLTGISNTKLYVIGGGAQSDLWLQIISDATGLILQRPENMEQGAAFGAARLGLAASERADPSEICQPVKTRDEITPNAVNRSYYQDRLARYRSLVPVLS